MSLTKTAIFVLGGLSVAFLGAAGKDGWDLTKRLIAPYFDRPLEQDFSYPIEGDRSPQDTRSYDPYRGSYDPYK